MSKNKAARRSFWLIATRAHSRMEVLTLDAGGEKVFPVFSFQEECELFLRLGETETNWWPRETTTGELVSLLLGLCSRADKVALDPLPGLWEREILELVSTGRRHFLRHLLGEVAAHPEPKNSSGRVKGRSDPTRLRKDQMMSAQPVAGREILVTIAEGGREVVSTNDLLSAKMLLATDGSEEAELATKSAVELANSTGSELHVVYVEPLPDFMKKNDAGTPGYDLELYETIEGEGRETLRNLTWRVKAAGGTVTRSHLRMGAVAEEIVALADELEVDLIIVGSRGLRGIRRTLAGSVSESVFRHARCPVMAVRAKGNPPSRRGGGRPRMRRVFPQEVGQASSSLAQAGSP